MLLLFHKTTIKASVHILAHVFGRRKQVTSSSRYRKRKPSFAWWVLVSKLNQTKLLSHIWAFIKNYLWIWWTLPASLDNYQWPSSWRNTLYPVHFILAMFCNENIPTFLNRARTLPCGYVIYKISKLIYEELEMYILICKLLHSNRSQIRLYIYRAIVDNL